jgi:hypothetical protein
MLEALQHSSLGSCHGVFGGKVGQMPQGQLSLKLVRGTGDGGQGKSFPQIGPTVASPSFVPLPFGSDDPNIE